MPTPAEPRHDTGTTNASSARSDVDETALSAPAPGASAVPGFDPPAVPNEVGALGPYRVVKELGRGGMGAVYAALDTRLERQLALKVMLPQFAADTAAKERFLREARAAAKITHDNVVTVYEADVRQGVPYIAMQFLEGCPLDEYLKKKGTPTIPQVLRIAAEAAAGLAAAHKIGLVHRDIKPGNLWLEAPHGRVKVLDFGLAKPVDADVELTKSGAVVGTPAYMSPEQARGEKVDSRTDLFSLGAVLYRLCTGKLPFNGPTTMAVLMALGIDEPPPVCEVNPTVPEPLAELIHQLLAKRADARPQSAAEVVQRVRTIAEDLAVPRALRVEQSTSHAQVMQPQVVYAVMPVTAGSPEANPFADLGTSVTELASGEPNAEPAPAAKPVRKAAGGRWLWPAAGFAALVALVAGVVIIIKNKDGTETKIEVPDGATVTVKDKGGKTLAQVGPGGKPPAVAGDPDRTAAEWVLALGGVVRVNGQIHHLATAAELPKERFALTGFALPGSAGWTDADLARFKDCKELAHLGLAHCTAVTDAGLAHFKGCTGLTHLSLGETKVTDAGLAHFKGRTGLVFLDLSGTGVTDAGLANFKDCKGLTELRLNGARPVTDAGLAHFKDCKLTSFQLGDTGVTDAGLAHFKGCTGLTVLHLFGTGVTDAGLEHFKGRERLSGLDLRGTAVTDAGLAHLKGCKGLTHLNLGGLGVTDAGLVHLQDCKGLTHLELQKTKVTAKGLADFHAALPACQITHNGGTIEAIDVDRKAAEWVIAQGGGVRVNGADKDIKAAADLPKERFTLTRVDLNGTMVSDAGLAQLKDLKGLTDLHLASAPVSGAGLVHLKELQSLTHLDLHGTKVSDAGLAHLAELKALKELRLTGTAVSGAGLAHLKELQSLTRIDLADTSVPDAGLAHLKNLKALKELYLFNAPVSDAGVEHLKELKALMHLDLRKTAVTAKGREALHAALPACQILHDGGVIEPKK